MASRDPLRNIIRTIRPTEAEIRRITMDAAKEADRMIRAHGDRLGDRVRTAQLQAARINLHMWRGIDVATRTGVASAFDSATEWQALFDEGMFARAGMSQHAWRESLMATSREGLDSYLSRKENGYRLSDRVYRNTALSRGYVDRAIDRGLLLGKSAAEIASDVRSFISPNTPGGAAYAAKRLARTEISNAYHATSIRNYQQTPWVDHAKWNLSESHPGEDECDEYATTTTVKNGEPGVYSVNDIPDHPHPQCLCFITPEDIGISEFVARFESGAYDAYVDETLRQAGVA